MVTRRFDGPPTHEEISLAAYNCWVSGYSQDASVNWEEARRRLLASRVWENQFLRVSILRNFTRQYQVLNLVHVSKALEKELVEMLCFFARQEWNQYTNGALGECQVVLNMQTGEVHVTRKEGFHPLDIFEMFD